MSLFWKREREVRRLLTEYFAVCDEALAMFAQAMTVYVRLGWGEEFARRDEEVHHLEGRADDLRVEVEKLLYSRSLLPESRGDLLRILEAFDHIPNLAETVTFMISTQRIEVPSQFLEPLHELVETNLAAYRHVRETVDRFLGDPARVEATVGAVDADESKSDREERHLITAIFATDLDKAEKLHLRELVGRISDISDCAEEVARRIEIVALKRHV